MSWLTQTLTSSIGKKVLMSLTGLFLCLFLVVHLIGNLQLFKDDGGYAFNTYAVMMTTFAPIKIISYLNYFFILFHAFWGIYLEASNRKARNVKYSVIRNQSTWSSRNMAVLGTILLVYIVVHMGDFWYKFHNEPLPYVQYTEVLNTGEIFSQQMSEGYTQDVKQVEFTSSDEGTRTVIVKDLYQTVAVAFQNFLLSFFYLLSMVVVGFHLYHGFQSAFQTLGINHPKYSPFIKAIGVWVFAFIIPAAFAAMPLYFYFKQF